MEIMAEIEILGLRIHYFSCVKKRFHAKIIFSLENIFYKIEKICVTILLKFIASYSKNKINSIITEIFFC